MPPGMRNARRRRRTPVGAVRPAPGRPVVWGAELTRSAYVARKSAVPASLMLVLVVRAVARGDGQENSPSGLWRTLGKRVGCKPSGVRIPHSPPCDESRHVSQMSRDMCHEEPGHRPGSFMLLQ